MTEAMLVKKRKRGWRIVAVLAVIVVVLGAADWLIGLPIDRAVADWRTGRVDEAIERLERWERLRLRPGDYAHALAVMYLTKGDRPAAEPKLRRIAARPPEWFPKVRKVEVGRRLVSLGRHEEFLVYDAAVRQRFESEEASLYRAAALLASGRTREAAAMFEAIDAGEVSRERLAALRAALEARRSGSFPLVTDAAGRTLAVWQISNEDLVAVNADFESLLDASAGPLTIEAQLEQIGTATTIETTLDPFVQKAALFALGGFRGSMVVIDVRSNDLLAVASTAGQGELGNLAFAGRYEAGSVVKPLTAAQAVDSGLPLQEIFPMTCQGFLVIDDRMFYDWARHGEITLDDAMATSCNVAFAHLGLRLGARPLLGIATAARFNDTADLAIIRVPLGTVDRAIRGRYELAELSVGLERHTMNALHLAMLGSAFANRGQMRTPRLLRARRTILGDRVALPDLEPPRRIMSEQAAEVVARTMRAVVEDPRGTGRRADIEGLPIAMKTGTAGTRENGFDALVVAFAPAGDPRIAIGFIAEDAGPAEIAGAKIANDFFTRMRERE